MEKIDEFSFIVEPLRLINCLIDTYILPKSTIHFSLKHKITQNIKLPILKDNVSYKVWFAVSFRNCCKKARNLSFSTISEIRVLNRSNPWLVLCNCWEREIDAILKSIGNELFKRSMNFSCLFYLPSLTSIKISEKKTLDWNFRYIRSIFFSAPPFLLITTFGRRSSKNPVFTVTPSTIKIETIQYRKARI